MSEDGSLLDADHPKSGVRTSGWTVSGRRFDRLLGVLILELYRAQIPERGVEPACVVDRVDKAWKIGHDVLEGFVCHQVHRFDLQCFHEALCLGIIVWIAPPSHRSDEPMIGEELGLHETVLRRWVKQFSPQATGAVRHPITQAPAPSPSDLISEVTRLRRENERLRMERDILKKAALILGSASR